MRKTLVNAKHFFYIIHTHTRTGVYIYLSQTLPHSPKLLFYN